MKKEQQLRKSNTIEQNKSCQKESKCSLAGPLVHLPPSTTDVQVLQGLAAEVLHMCSHSPNRQPATSDQAAHTEGSASVSLPTQASTCTPGACKHQIQRTAPSSRQDTNINAVIYVHTSKTSTLQYGRIPNQPSNIYNPLGDIRKQNKKTNHIQPLHT